jgi:gamma-glutamyltranspeptidase/glutathione hydrolase
MNSHYPNFSDKKPIFTPVTGHKGMVSTQEKTATKVGVNILKSGGNAIDAAVTIGFALAVTLPRAGNIAGGGFMVIKDAKNKVTTIDYREKAPKSATSELFLDEEGNVIPEKPSYSFLSIGVPGTVYGLITALENFGTISLKEALEPAIKLAKNGFPVYEDLYQTLLSSKGRLQRSPASMRVFFKDDKPYRIGETLRQKDLANSLEKISKEGIDGFYKDTIAEKIVTYVNDNDGILSIEDFEEYEPKLRAPIIGTYREYDIFSMPPPSSGGILLVDMLNILEDFPLNEMGSNNAIYVNLLSQVMKMAYYDRYRYLGDTDYEDVPVKHLTSKKYAYKLRENIMEPGCPQKIQKKTLYSNNMIPETTHFSVMDSEENAVANTYSLALNYGSKFMVPGTGILLNNEMGDFTAKLGHIDGSGMKGGRNNTIKPGKRMLSSMTPTIIVKDDKPFMITGSVGGSLIITTVLQVVLNVIEHKMNIAEAINTPRFHRQWTPDHLRLEPGFSKDTLKLLEKWGHKVIIDSAYGGSQSIMFKNGVFYGAADLRTTSAYAAGL